MAEVPCGDWGTREHTAALIAAAAEVAAAVAISVLSCWLWLSLGLS